MKPMGDRVLLKRVDAQTETKGGLYIPEAAQEKPSEAVVVGVGPGLLTEEGRRMPMDVQIGDKVLIGKYVGTEVVIDDVKHVIVRETDIICVVV